jgi:hypothetical protein
MTPEEFKRVSHMQKLLIGHLKNDTPDVGSYAMANLLASHTQDTREVWLEHLGVMWDYHHIDKVEK